jgi:transposase
MRAYGSELRRRIVEAHNHGEGSVRDLAERFAVAPNTVQNYLNLQRATGSIDPRPHGGGVPPKIDDQGLQQVRALVDETPDATVDELADDFSRRHHLAVGRSTMDRALHRLNMTRKKSSSCDRAGHVEVHRGATRLHGGDSEHFAGAPGLP